MEPDDPYERHYQRLEDEQYWEDRLKQPKEDYDFKSKYRGLTIQRDLGLIGQKDGSSKASDASQEQKAGKQNALDGLLKERRNCASIIRGFTWLPPGARSFWNDKLNAIDFVNGSSVIKELESLREQLRDHERFLWDYGKPYELRAIRNAVDSLGRMESLYSAYK